MPHDIWRRLLPALMLAAVCACERAPVPATGAASASATRRVRLREEVLRRAKVWHHPATPLSLVRFDRSADDPEGFALDADVSCRFVPRPAHGTTPKFYCDPGDGALKVKYGETNPELQAEVAASRLLDALGFGADRMFLVRRVRCRGCPPFPFEALRCASETPLRDSCFAGGLDERHEVVFDSPVIERETRGRPIDGEDGPGWAWFELERIDPSVGGASRAEVDALRLIAVFLAHWDNKAENQRLLCMPGAERDDGGCRQPIAMIQDLGATFGPMKVDLVNWARTPVWTDVVACTISMKNLPYHGGTFPDWQISEAGRRLLADLLGQLSRRQVVDLFTTSRFGAVTAVSARTRHPDEWADAFAQKVREITAAHCPS